MKWNSQLRLKTYRVFHSLVGNTTPSVFHSL
ncbi:MAG: hypothetical protein ACI8TP_000374 [Acidimicrobiales bacterium]|jgi:hypothetical protein